jgi:hypothetical protein
VLPANATVPIRVYDLYQGAAFAWSFPDGLNFSNGLVFAVSTTEETLTISTDKIELFVDAESPVDDTGWSAAGDYTTGQPSVQVWADASGPKRLMRVELTYLSGGGGAVWLFIYAGDASPAASLAVPSLPLQNAGASNEFFFGDGLVPSIHSGATVYDGCTLALSDTGTGFSALTTNEFAIKASYK